MSAEPAGFAGVAWRAALHHIPLEVAVELTHRCTFHCIHCYIPGRDRPDRLPTGRLVALLDELKELGTLFLTFTGGEPLLHPHWREIVRAARRRAFVVRLLSNGMYLTAEDAHLLGDLGVRVSLSMYAAEAGVFEAVTGVPGSFDRLLRSVEDLQAAGVALSVKVPMMRANVTAVEGVARWAGERGIPCHVFALLTHSRDGDLYPLRQRVGWEEAATRWPSPRLPDHGGGQEHPHSQRFASCAAGIRTATITPTGDVLACQLLPTVAGNVAEESFRRVWEHSPWLQRLRQLRVADLPHCAACPHLGACGRCPARAMVEGEGLEGVDPVACVLAGVGTPVLPRERARCSRR